MGITQDFYIFWQFVDVCWLLMFVTPWIRKMPGGIQRVKESSPGSTLHGSRLGDWLAESCWPPVTAKQQFLWSIWNGWDLFQGTTDINRYYANIKELQTASTCSSCSLIWGIFPKRPYFNETWDVSLYVSWVWGCHTFRRPTWMVGKPCSFLAGVGGSELCDVLRPGIHTLKYPVLEPRFFSYELINAIKSHIYMMFYMVDNHR